MKPLSIARLVVIAAVVGVLVFGATRLLVARGGNPLLVTYLIPIILVVGSAVLLWAGWHVRRLKQHKTTWMTALSAMRVAIAARAGALIASGVVGVGLGTAVAAASRLDASLMADAARDGVIAAAGGLVLCVCGVIVERWCLVDMDDSDTDPRTPPGAPQAGAA